MTTQQTPPPVGDFDAFDLRWFVATIVKGLVKFVKDAGFYLSLIFAAVYFGSQVLFTHGLTFQELEYREWGRDITKADRLVIESLNWLHFDAAMLGLLLCWLTYQLTTTKNIPAHGGAPHDSDPQHRSG